MQNVDLYCLVMAGGKGTRFWPESTTKKPKQYLKLVSDKPLLFESLKRFEGLVEKKNRYIVTVKNQEALCKECAEDLIDEDAIVYEPSGRNTAPCILLSLLDLLHKGAKEDDVVAIVPSDHVILNTKGFRSTISKASKVAVEEKKIVTIGINPNFPHTGFGYIHKGEDIKDNVFKVESFKEKPDFDTAKSYLESGEYYWNAGMFMGTFKVLLEEFSKHAPEVYKYADELKSKLDNFSELSEVYEQIPSDSIDYAIMEKSDRVAVCPAEFDWNDLGSWDALESVIDPVKGNIIAAADDLFVSNAEGNVVYAPGKFVSLVNVNDMIVVSNDNVLMVLPKKDSQEVKKIVSHLNSEDPSSELL